MGLIWRERRRLGRGLSQLRFMGMLICSGRNERQGRIGLMARALNEHNNKPTSYSTVMKPRMFPMEDCVITLGKD